MEELQTSIANVLIRACHSVYAVYRGICRRTSTTYATDVWELHEFEEDRSEFADTREELPEMYDNKVLLHHTRRETPDFTDHRVAVHWSLVPRETYRIRDLYDSPIPPWYYIGYITEEGAKVDCTALLSPFVVEGNKITRPLLDVIVENGKGLRWTYLDKTFNQVDFPSNGIIISDAPHGDDQNIDSTSQPRERGVEIQ